MTPEAVGQEVRELHGFFVGWLTGALPASRPSFARFTDAMAPEFRIGHPDGTEEGLPALTARLRRAHGARATQRPAFEIANVATRWALDQPGVAAVLVGARPGEREHRADNLRVFSFALDEADRTAIAAATARMRRIPGDCGDEYRRPPFLTAAGDLSDHLDALPRPFEAQPVAGRSDRRRVGSGSVWEGIGDSRAVRVGDRILVAGTTATHGAGELVCPGDVAGQTVYIPDKIAAALGALGGSLSDVVRTRIYLRDVRQWEVAARVHGSYFAELRPANTLVQAALVGEYEVEIEAEAVLS